MQSQALVQLQRENVQLTAPYPEKLELVLQAIEVLALERVQQRLPAQDKFLLALKHVLEHQHHPQY